MFKILKCELELRDKTVVVVAGSAEEEFSLRKFVRLVTRTVFDIRKKTSVNISEAQYLTAKDVGIGSVSTVSRHAKDT